jgi:hypothetical protein
MSYFELSDQGRRSFMGRTFRYGTLDGPQELYSFADRADRPAKPDQRRPGRREPMYFLTKSNLIEATKRSSNPHDVFEFTRQGVALCEDWNDMRFVFILTLPAHVSVGAWFGLAKFQPRVAKDRAAPGINKDRGVLAGGWLQYVIDIDDRILHYVSAAIRTGRFG